MGHDVLAVPKIDAVNIIAIGDARSTGIKRLALGQIQFRARFIQQLVHFRIGIAAIILPAASAREAEDIAIRIGAARPADQIGFKLAPRSRLQG